VVSKRKLKVTEWLKPAVAAIANKIDRDGLSMAAANTANIVGTAGTPPTGLITYLTGAAYLDSEGAPRDGRRSMVVEPFTSATIVDSLKGLFVPQEAIGEQYRKGLMGRDSGGMNWKLDQNVYTQTFGSWSANTIAINVTTATGFLTSGWSQFSTISLTGSAASTLNAGDTFTIPGVYAVNPQNRQSYGKLRNFVVMSTIITAGQFQNVSVTSTGSQNITAFNNTGVSSPQNIMMHRNAFTLAVADLELPDGVHFAGRASDKEIGLSMRVVRQYTINVANDESFALVA
jgi:hypothetical protein